MVHILEFLNKSNNHETGGRHICHKTNRRAKKLWVGYGSSAGGDKTPMPNECEEASEGTYLDKKIVKLDKLHALACEKVTLSFTADSSVEKVPFGLVQNGKRSLDFLKEKKDAWDRLINKYAP